MDYSLAQIAKTQGNKRRGTVVSVRARKAPMRLEKDLLTILREVVQNPDSDQTLTNAVQKAMGWLNSTARWNLDIWEANALAQLGVDLRGMATLMDSDPEVQKALDWLIALMRDLQLQTSARLATQRAASIAQGLTAKEAAAALRNVVAKQMHRAELIAHDQTQKIASKIAEAQQKEAGITKYKWNHSFLPNARRHHVERQGNIYQWSRPPRGGHPGTEVNCRCTAEAVVEVT